MEEYLEQVEVGQRECILVVDSDKLFRRRLTNRLQMRGYETIEASSYGQAVHMATLIRPDYLVTELRIPGGSGIQLVGGLRREIPEIHGTVVLTGCGSIVSAVAAIRVGATDFLEKPLRVNQVIASLTGRAGQRAVYAEPEMNVPSLERMRWEHLNRVLEDCDGNISRAARRLGIGRRSLQRKLSYGPPAK